MQTIYIYTITIVIHIIQYYDYENLDDRNLEYAHNTHYLITAMMNIYNLVSISSGVFVLILFHFPFIFVSSDLIGAIVQCPKCLLPSRHLLNACVLWIFINFFFYFELTDNFEVPMHRTKDLTWKYVVQYRTPFATTRFINTLSLSQYWRLRRSNQSQPIQIITRNVLLCWLCDNNSANSKTIHLEYVTLSTVVYTHMR